MWVGSVVVFWCAGRARATRSIGRLPAMAKLGPVAGHLPRSGPSGSCSVSPRPGTVRRSSCSPRLRSVPTSVALDRVRSSSARCLRCPRRRPGLFVVDLDGAMIGMVTLDRRDAERPVTSVRMPGRPSSATCSCRRRGDAGTPPRRAQRHSTGSPARFPASRWCSAPRPPTTARCASGEAGVHRGGAVRGVRRRAVVRRVVLGHAVRLSSCSKRSGPRGH